MTINQVGSHNCASLRSLVYHFHLLSLDVVLGAAGSYAFACKALFQPVSYYFVIVLAISVWIIYLADHILDSVKIPYSPKYKLYSRHKKVLATVIFILSALDGYLILKFLPAQILHFGFILGAFLILYLAGQHFLRGKFRSFFPKEILISVIYTLAVWLYPLLHTQNIGAASALFLGLHFLLVLTNVLIFSFFEKEEDTRYRKATFFSGIPDYYLRTAISVLGISSVMLAIFIGLYYRYPMMIVVPVLISVVYLLEITFSGLSIIKKNYPSFTDGIFMLFLLYLD